MFVKEGKLLEVNCIQMRVATEFESTSTFFPELSVVHLCASPCTPVQKIMFRALNPHSCAYGLHTYAIAPATKHIFASLCELLGTYKDRLPEFGHEPCFV